MEKAPRGRPKTLDREQTIAVAAQAYWRDGVDSVSLNEICRRAGLSKPSVYREFGNEDGLMKAALVVYQRDVLAPVYQMIAANHPFEHTLDDLISLVTRVADEPAPSHQQEMPSGCLLVKMRESYNRLGVEVRQEIDQAKQQALAVYEAWVERAIAAGQLNADSPPRRIAIYIDAQLNNALQLLARGEPNDEVRDILRMALSVLRSENAHD